MKINDQQMIKKKKKKTRSKEKSVKKRNKKSRLSTRRHQNKRNKSNANKRNRNVDKNKLIKTTQQNDFVSSQSEEKSTTTKILSKDVAKLKTLYMFEPWIKRDELDVRKLFELSD